MMSDKTRPIGMLDSGIGGFTVVQALRQTLPGENIVYCADSANCPYGNRTSEDIITRTKGMLRFLEEKQVKLALVACNSISALWDAYGEAFPFPIMGIIEPVSQQIAESKIPSVGLIATLFTVESGQYEVSMKQYNPAIKVYSQGSKNLAMLVDSGDFAGDAIRDEVCELVDKLMQQHPVKHIILGCTHYPHVKGVFSEFAPDVSFIDPAAAQAQAARHRLLEEGLQNQNRDGHLSVHTSGKAAVCQKILDRLGIAGYSVHGVEKF
jgi:glutamate racemase